MIASFFLGSKWLRRLAGGVVAVLLVWGIGWLALPPWLKTQLETRLGDQLGRRVTVGQVEFKPWSLELTLHDFTVAQAAGTAPQAEAAPQLSVKRIYIDAELQSVLRLAPVVDAITLEAPHLRLTHLGQGRYDFDECCPAWPRRQTSPLQILCGLPCTTWRWSMARLISPTPPTTRHIC